MRKLPLLLACAIALALGVAGIAQAVEAEQGLTIKLGATKAGTKKKPKSVKFIDVTTTTKPTGTDRQFAATKAVVSFDKNLVFNSAKFPSCSYADASKAKPACKKAKVGSGTAEAYIGGEVPVTLDVTAFNGPKGKNLWLHVYNAATSTNTALKGQLQKASGKYGKKLVVTIPTELQQPLQGLYVVLTKFNVKVAATLKKGKVPYVALAGCTKGKLNFDSTVYFTDGDKKPASTKVPCKK